MASLCGTGPLPSAREGFLSRVRGFLVNRFSICFDEHLFF